MKKISKFLLLLISLGFTNLSIAATCAVYQPDYSQSPGAIKQIEESSLDLSFNNEGSIGPNNYKKTKISENLNVFYNIQSSGAPKNGCHRVFIAFGIFEKQKTWMNYFSHWCKDENPTFNELLVFSGSMNQMHLRCQL
ncbi:MAG: hypothetical protein KA715_04175 [Xanthomonadaceae bacterium]|nr:hypothetical protein [Xanthomonadaceae bacterium]